MIHGSDRFNKVFPATLRDLSFFEHFSLGSLVERTTTPAAQENGF